MHNINKSLVTYKLDVGILFVGPERNILLNAFYMFWGVSLLNEWKIFTKYPANFSASIVSLCICLIRLFENLYITYILPVRQQIFKFHFFICLSAFIGSYCKTFWIVRMWFYIVYGPSTAAWLINILLVIFLGLLVFCVSNRTINLPDLNVLFCKTRRLISSLKYVEFLLFLNHNDLFIASNRDCYRFTLKIL